MNAQNPSVPIMDKEVHKNKQVQFTGILYSKTFQFIHNNRKTKTRGKERFKEILCYQ
ncbi:MAG TPA: hypothetical protein VJ697_08545 [Nitrososphaeraceae archaeon]|nr:hypothetical protein [Nitrososphaeraceae archaeon]